MPSNYHFQREMCASCLLKKFGSVYMLHMKNSFISWQKFALKFSLPPVYWEDWACVFADFGSLPDSPLGDMLRISMQGRAQPRWQWLKEGQVIRAQSIQFHLFPTNTFCLLKVSWPLEAHARTAEQLISCSSPRVHSLIRSQIQHTCHLCPNSQHLLSEWDMTLSKTIYRFDPRARVLCLQTDFSLYFEAASLHWRN